MFTSLYFGILHRLAPFFGWGVAARRGAACCGVALLLLTPTAALTALAELLPRRAADGNMYIEMPFCSTEHLSQELKRGCICHKAQVAFCLAYEGVAFLLLIGFCAAIVKLVVKLKRNAFLYNLETQKRALATNVFTSATLVVA